MLQKVVLTRALVMYGGWSTFRFTKDEQLKPFIFKIGEAGLFKNQAGTPSQ